MKKIKFIPFLVIVTLLIVSACSDNNPASIQTVEETTAYHNQDIEVDELWNSDKTHFVSSNISIRNSSLKIMPGAKVNFETNASIAVSDSAFLIADGSEKQILFTSGTNQKGAWKNIQFLDGAMDDSCRLINCKIEYGGGDPEKRGVIYCENSSPTIVNCEITNMPTFGVEIHGNCRNIELHDNIISNCDFVPIQVDIENISAIGTNTYLNNSYNFIRLTNGQVTFDDTLTKRSIPYRVADGIHIKNASLMIEPGVSLSFENGECATISENGSMFANGETQSVLFTASKRGGWKGIFFEKTADDKNCDLKNCVIENAGQDEFFPSNIIINECSPNISNCLIRQSTGYGIYISGKFNPDYFENNTIISNALAPVSLSAGSVAGFSPGMYWGNGIDAIEVRGGNIDGLIVENCSWENLTIPYLIKDVIQILSSTLIIEPGVNIQMAEASGFEVSARGGFIADGSANMIKFTGQQSQIGIWKNIYFSNSANENNCQLINCQIAYGGGDTYRSGMIYCDNISPLIKNCYVEYSQTYGVFLKGNAQINEIQSNVFYGNILGDYFISP